MTVSENGIAFIKANEGFVSKPSNDEGYMMWGYGHDRVGDEPIPEEITLDEADELLRKDLAERFEPSLNRLVPWSNQNQFDALADFAYNLGTGALAQLVAHGESLIPSQMMRWIYAGNKVLPGLVKRRAKEATLYGS